MTRSASAWKSAPPCAPTPSTPPPRSAPRRPDTAATGHDRHGEADAALELVVDRESLRPLIADLDDRDRHILKLRFRDDLTQTEIGERLGLSQMHISRLLTRTFTTLRTAMLAGT
ncbi:sigma-70 family RNA polymerase sigma factor [Embleya sp. MST-111070]|uniref:sigma-70 family RNA polymerase sigma factor n=1 Tax=Embleya sp. MST-111070 TaxID=3398231 RepID=UPI003F73BEC4